MSLLVAPAEPFSVEDEIVGKTNGVECWCRFCVPRRRAARIPLKRRFAAGKICQVCARSILGNEIPLRGLVAGPEIAQ